MALFVMLRVMRVRCIHVQNGAHHTSVGERHVTKLALSKHLESIEYHDAAVPFQMHGSVHWQTSNDPHLMTDGAHRPSRAPHRTKACPQYQTHRAQQTQDGSTYTCSLANDTMFSRCCGCSRATQSRSTREPCCVMEATTKIEECNTRQICP